MDTNYESGFSTSALGSRVGSANRPLHVEVAALWKKLAEFHILPGLNRIFVRYETGVACKVSDLVEIEWRGPNGAKSPVYKPKHTPDFDSAKMIPSPVLRDGCRQVVDIVRTQRYDLSTIRSKLACFGSMISVGRPTIVDIGNDDRSACAACVGLLKTPVCILGESLFACDPDNLGDQIFEGFHNFRGSGSPVHLVKWLNHSTTLDDTLTDMLSVERRLGYDTYHHVNLLYKHTHFHVYLRGMIESPAGCITFYESMTFHAVLSTMKKCNLWKGDKHNDRIMCRAHVSFPFPLINTLHKVKDRWVVYVAMFWFGFMPIIDEPINDYWLLLLQLYDILSEFKWWKDFEHICNLGMIPILDTNIDWIMENYPWFMRSTPFTIVSTVVEGVPDS